METPFQKVITRSYTEVTIGDGIHTTEFLEATDGLINMLDLFENTSFSVVQNDMRNNVKKIRTKYVTNEANNNTLENLMANEADQKRRVATEAVLWLKRGLEFTGTSLLHNLDHPEDEMTVSFKLAYEQTLSPYHNFLIRPIFSLAMNACPWRADFYQTIGVTNAETQGIMREWLLALHKIIDQLNQVFKSHPSYTKH